MCMLDTIHAKRDEIHAIAKKHKAEKLWVFGSVARKEERPDSDVDFLVEFGKGASLRNWSGFHLGMEDLFGRKVDVICSGALDREPYFAHAVRKDMLPV